MLVKHNNDNPNDGVLNITFAPEFIRCDLLAEQLAHGPKIRRNLRSLLIPVLSSGFRRSQRL